MTIGDAEQRLATAYHEVGHAAVARRFGYDVYLVDVGAAPVCRFRHPWENTPAGRWRLLTVTVAGQLAEQRLALERGWWSSPRDVLGELLEVEDLFDEGVLDGDDLGAWEILCVDDDPRALLAEAIESAEEILAERWPEVCEEAERLAARA